MRNKNSTVMQKESIQCTTRFQLQYRFNSKKKGETRRKNVLSQNVEKGSRIFAIEPSFKRY